MSLIICSNQFLENSGDYHSAYSFHNHLSNTLTLPEDSEVAVQSVKINKNGVFTINRKTAIYLWFNKELVLGTTALEQTTGYVHYARPHFDPSDEDVLEVSPDEFAARLQIGINNAINNPESYGLNTCIAKSDATGFKGFEFTFKQSKTNGVDISASLVESDFDLTYLSGITADSVGSGMTYTPATKTFTALKSGAGSQKFYNAALCKKPLSLINGAISLDLGNAASTSWNLGLVRSDANNSYYPEYYYDLINNESWRPFDFYDFVVQTGQASMGGGGDRFLKIYHSVNTFPGTNQTGLIMKEIKYYNIVGNPFYSATGVPYNWSNNTSASNITDVSIIIKNEQVSVTVTDGTTVWTLLDYDAALPKEQNFKPVTETCRFLYGKFHMSANASNKSLVLTEYKAHTNIPYGDENVDWWSNLVLNGQQLGAGLEVDSRFYNDMTDATKYAQLGLSGAGVLVDYQNIMIFNPSTLYIPSDLANGGKLLGFPLQTHIDPTSTSGTDNLFTSFSVPSMKSNTSVFVRLNNLGFNSYNAGVGSQSKILYSLPRFSNNGEESGTGLYFEPHERIYLALNNPAPLTINEFSVDFVNENESLATDLVGKSVVLFHIRKRATL